MALLRHPDPGMKVKIVAHHFNPERIGIYVGPDLDGKCVVNTDPYNILPEGHACKTQVVDKEQLELMI